MCQDAKGSLGPMRSSTAGLCRYYMRSVERFPGIALAARRGGGVYR